jgi:hypothetical protein
MPTRQKVIVVVALLALAASAAVLFVYFRGGSVVHNSKFDQFVAQVNKAINDERYELVTVAVNDERTKVTIAGKVSGQADLDELRNKIKAIDPQGEYDLAVTPGAPKRR